MLASFTVFYKQFSPAKRWDIRADNSSGTKENKILNLTYIRENGKMTGHLETSKEQKRKEKLRSADMARLDFQYVLKSSQQQHTL